MATGSGLTAAPVASPLTPTLPLTDSGAAAPSTSSHANYKTASVPAHDASTSASTHPNDIRDGGSMKAASACRWVNPHGSAPSREGNALEGHPQSARAAAAGSPTTAQVVGNVRPLPPKSFHLFILQRRCFHALWISSRRLGGVQLTGVVHSLASKDAVNVAIGNGSKVYESRIFTPGYAKVEVGDVLYFGGREPVLALVGPFPTSINFDQDIQGCGGEVLSSPIDVWRLLRRLVYPMLPSGTTDEEVWRFSHELHCRVKDSKGKTKWPTLGVLQGLLRARRPHDRLGSPSPRAQIQPSAVALCPHRRAPIATTPLQRLTRCAFKRTLDEPALRVGRGHCAPPAIDLAELSAIPSCDVRRHASEARGFFWNQATARARSGEAAADTGRTRLGRTRQGHEDEVSQQRSSPWRQPHRLHRPACPAPTQCPRPEGPEV